ncbi:hypothetical protein EBU99_01910 [bacterium]|nr:hypothetical protein [bacterium]
MNSILLVGSSGRLGREISLAAQSHDLNIQAVSREVSKKIHEVVLSPISEDRKKKILIDVSLPEGTETIADQIIENNAIPEQLSALVIGTTGHSEAQKNKLIKVSKLIPVVISSNFSRGIYLFEELLCAKTSSGASVADLARQLGFDLAVWESHHSMKKDAPSGTAKTLAAAAGVASERISSTRVGAVVGEHSLMFSQGAEELRITHTAHARRLFADGALDLCERIFKSQLKNKLYSMTEAYNELMQKNL